MTKSEIKSKFDSIVEFADIGDFLEAPVSTYSSGMTVKLGFSIAIHSELDIEAIRKAGQAAGFVREELKKAIVPGISTKDLDEIARSLIELTGGKSAFFGYRGFPGQICNNIIRSYLFHPFHKNLFTC
jgi:hypothetical protein